MTPRQQRIAELVRKQWLLRMGYRNMDDAWCQMLPASVRKHFNADTISKKRSILSLFKESNMPKIVTSPKCHTISADEVTLKEFVLLSRSKVGNNIWILTTTKSIDPPIPAWFRLNDGTILPQTDQSFKEVIAQEAGDAKYEFIAIPIQKFQDAIHKLIDEELN
jgi:hypothetical protein